MDEIRFSVEREIHRPIGEFTVLDIRINGSRLQEIVQLVEARQATGRDRAPFPGDYMGLNPREDFFMGRLLGDSIVSTLAGISQRTTLLGCTCGDPGCWPLTAKVEVSDRTVTWCDFLSANDEWDLSSIGPFVFDRDDCERSLAQALALP